MITASASLAEIVRDALTQHAQAIEVNFRIGITGTRNNPPAQSAKLAETLGIIAYQYPGTVEIHHGCCTGIDLTAHNAALRFSRIELHGHPGANTRGKSPYRMPAMETAGFHAIYPETTYRKRNLDIVMSCSVLIACPLFPESDGRSLRSGTWQTIRFARSHNKPIIYILPSGIIQL
jgi:hypothetical protein